MTVCWTSIIAIELLIIYEFSYDGSTVLGLDFIFPGKNSATNSASNMNNTHLWIASCFQRACNELYAFVNDAAGTACAISIPELEMKPHTTLSIKHD